MDFISPGRHLGEISQGTDSVLFSEDTINDLCVGIGQVKESRSLIAREREFIDH